MFDLEYGQPAASTTLPTSRPAFRDLLGCFGHADAGKRVLESGVDLLYTSHQVRSGRLSWLHVGHEQCMTATQNVMRDRSSVHARVLLSRRPRGNAQRLAAQGMSSGTQGEANPHSSEHCAPQELIMCICNHLSETRDSGSSAGGGWCRMAA